MHSTYYQEPHFTGQETQYFPGTYPELPTFYQYLHDSTYQDAVLDLRVAPHAQSLTPLSISEDGCSYVITSPLGTPTVRHQPIGLPSTGNIAETSGHDNAGNNSGREGPQVHHSPTSPRLVPQFVYTPPRQQKKFGNPKSIDFFVYGEMGIRLADALEGKWNGFVGRDDRPLSEEDRAQIMLRLLVVGCPPWESKISTVDYTSKRQPITREKLASDVAKSVKRFLEREKVEGHEDDSSCHWQDTEMLGDMYLTRLVRVSTGSWQPEILMVQRST